MQLKPEKYALKTGFMQLQRESSDRLVIISSKYNDKLTKLYTNCLHIILIVSVKYLRV